MEISTDPDGTVYVRWHGGGPWTVLTEDGQVSSEHGLGGTVDWFAVHEQPIPHRVTASARKAAS